MEQTFILIKPEGVLIGLAGRIMSKFDNKGFTLKGLKMITVDRPFVEKHFRPYIVYQLCSGPVVAMIWEGEDVVLVGREIIKWYVAVTMDPETGNNLIHGSLSVESAYKEAALWFPDGTGNGPDAAARDIGRIPVTGFNTMEQTLILVNPCGDHTGLVGKVIRRFDRKGFTLKGLKMITVDRTLAEEYYISPGAVVAMIWEGKNVVSTGRGIVGKTILSNDSGSNLIHGSDSVESAYKEIALWFPDGPVKPPCHVARPKACDIGRISVTGFDNDLPQEDVNIVLREHFASCGKITDVCIDDGTTSCVTYIYFVGEGAVDKALELGGVQVNGGWKVSAKAFPFRDHGTTSLTVQGYSPSFTESQIKDLLKNHFSSCGLVTSVTVYNGISQVNIKGFDAIDKALELNGSYVGKRKVLVRSFGRVPRYTVHHRCESVYPRPCFQFEPRH